MTILFLADINSIHTIKWVNGLSKNNLQVKIWSLDEPNSITIKNLDSNVDFFSFGIGKYKTSKLFSKVFYLLALPHLFKIYRNIKPDIVHSHYASSYGLLGILLNHERTITSLWGTDTFEFPKKNVLNKMIFKIVMRRSNQVLSTSTQMAIEAGKYTSKNIIITPFGVDTTIFKPDPTIKNNPIITIGTIKLLEKKYGIDTLIKAFHLALTRLNQFELYLKIIGEGSHKNSLINLVNELGISDKVEFVGYVNNSDIPKYLNQFDIFGCLSNEESFGVSVVEASSCGIPIISSNVGGLPEVVIHNKTGFLVEPNNPKKASEVIIKLVKSYSTRNRMSIEGRSFVLSNFDQKTCIEKMLKIYKEQLNIYK